MEGNCKAQCTNPINGGDRRVSPVAPAESELIIAPLGTCTDEYVKDHKVHRVVPLSCRPALLLPAPCSMRPTPSVPLHASCSPCPAPHVPLPMSTSMRPALLHTTLHASHSLTGFCAWWSLPGTGNTRFKATRRKRACPWVGAPNPLCLTLHVPLTNSLALAWDLRFFGRRGGR